MNNIDEGKIAVWLMLVGIVIALAIALYVYLPPYLKAKDDIAMYELARDLHDAEYNKMSEFFSVYKKMSDARDLQPISPPHASFNWKSGSGLLLGAIVAIVIFAVYFLPTWIAIGRRNSVAIFFVNLIFGFTVLGWLISFIWACVSQKNEAKNGH